LLYIFLNKFAAKMI